MGGFGHASLTEWDWSGQAPAATPPARPRNRTLPARYDQDPPWTMTDLGAGAPPADTGAAESTDAWWNAPAARQVIDHGLPARPETMSPEERYQADLMTHTRSVTEIGTPPESMRMRPVPR